MEAEGGNSRGNDDTRPTAGGKKRKRGKEKGSNKKGGKKAKVVDELKSADAIRKERQIKER